VLRPDLRPAGLPSPNTLGASVPAALFTDASGTKPGLVGTYVNRSLRNDPPQDDWRVSQAVAGTRVDRLIRFSTGDWGQRAAVGITSGTDADWENFSVQWDGYLEVRATVRVATRSDDGSRMWIDLNGDGLFAASGDEYLSNHWGSGQAVTLGPLSVPLNPGRYRLRIQYEEGYGANDMFLLFDPISAVTQPTVRVAYLVPSNRTAQPNAVSNLRQVMQRFREWCAEQMERNGFGPKTFLLETETDGVTPKVHVLTVEETDDYLRGDIWPRTIHAAFMAGVPTWSDSQVWLLVPECHVQRADGSIEGGTALGGGWGTGSSGGIGMVGSDGLARYDPAFLTDDRRYAGLVIPEVGPYPLVQNVSFPWFEQDTLSTVSSSMVGAAWHELGHGFGLGHTFACDENFHGNLMANGLRGVRGNLYPERYPTDYMRLSYSSAVLLNVSRYFNSQVTFTDNTQPTLSILTSGTVSPVDGMIEIRFSAQDNGDLAAALLIRNGDVAEVMQLSGSSVEASFRSQSFAPGELNRYTMQVVDRQGNKQSTDFQLTVTAGGNQAPWPFVKITPPTPGVGQPVTLSASQSHDPNQSASSLRVEWDTDGDGEFDTAPSTDKTFVTTYQAVSVRQIRARITDDAGAQTVSASVGLRVISLIGYEGDVAPRGAANGSLTVSDWVQVGRFAAALDAAAEGAEFQRADCAPRLSGGELIGGDGRITVTDWVQAGRYAAGLDPLTPTLGPTGPTSGLLGKAPAASTIAKLDVKMAPASDGASDEAVRDQGVRVGRGVFTAPAGRLGTLSSALGGVAVRAVPAIHDDRVLIQVMVEAPSPVAGLGFSLAFDASALQYRQTRPQEGGAAVLLVNAKRANAGLVGIAMAMPAGQSLVAGARSLLEIEFTVINPGGLGSGTGLVFTDAPVYREIVDMEANPGRAVWLDGAVSGPNAGGGAESDAWLTGRLSMSTSAEGVLTISWPSDLGAGLLESSPSLGSDATWSRVMDMPTASGTGAYSVRVQAGETTRFYRLRGK
jgi:hypothetical protein